MASRYLFDLVLVPAQVPGLFKELTRPKQRSELGPEHDVSGCDSLIPRPQRLTGKVIGFHPSCGLSKPNQLCLKPPQLGGVRNLC